ncbi:glycoside hydrolase family 55 protein [Mycena floridula]|nr:glycoside hydrolase family 55 protein [Mycena floridula]
MASTSVHPASTTNRTAAQCLGPGTAAPGDPFWLELIKHQGNAPFNPNSTYQVFRNVKDFGAIGDGMNDDSAAINLAISSGERCGGGNCISSTISPAVVYFPAGTYLVSKSIIPYYYTVLIGDARNPPTLLAAPSFNDIAVIDVNPYTANGQWYQNQNTFFRSIRNFIIDVRQVPFDKQQGTGIHWQVAQATLLSNIVFEMSTQTGTAHQGVWMENGSGGFMGDLVFNGGKFGMWVGNQQFTVRNITVNNADTGVFGVWNWGWTFQDITFNKCKTVAFDMTTGNSIAAEAIRDVEVNDTPIFMRFSTGSATLSSSFVLNNIKLNNVPTGIIVADSQAVLLNGTLSTMTIDSWVQGNSYLPPSSGNFTQNTVKPVPIPASLLNDQGKVVGRAQPQYADYALSQFVSVKDYGAVGNGVDDDQPALQAILDEFAGCKIIFFDAGTYILKSTLNIPSNVHIVGEAWSTLAGAGPFFQDINNPQVVVKVGEKGSTGKVEISDMLFTTVGPAAGAIVVEFNVHGEQAAAGMWSSHIRLAGAAGSNLQAQQCPQFGGDMANCMTAFLALHLTPESAAYIEGSWIWLADHDLEDPTSAVITAFAGRGVLSESQGPVWMIGTASEHFTLYQYNLVNAKDHYMGLIQTETPYFQPLADSSVIPFPVNVTYKDPIFSPSAWALTVQSSSNIHIFGAGLYSFYSAYSQDCLNSRNCQSQIVDIDSESTDIVISSLSTIASEYQLSRNQQGVIKQGDNVNGLVSTVSVWKSE